MEPAMWRLTVRALLKVDVYGIAGRRCNDLPEDVDVDGAGDPFHLGLKDIVQMMENRSRARHAVDDDDDALQGKGQGQGQGHPWTLAGKPGPGGKPTCQQVIDIARASIEQLCIA
ncbi:hypothetical protein F5Y17DRAFT_460300 [Xylariaceae sp. FL0594]|nr:hypothetical protein F5Y17DRAFT_460300 [Xylariaceae sp. FL0594]